MKRNREKSAIRPPLAAMSMKARALLALASACLYVLSLPSLSLWPCAWVALVPLLFALRGAGVRQAFFLGLLFGAAYAIGTAHWVFYALYAYSNAGFILSAFFLFMIIGAGVGVYCGLFGLCSARVYAGGRLPAVAQAAAVACLWVSFEYARGVIGGAPWGLLGHTQYSLRPLIQIADIAGTYGVSFIVAFANGCFYEALQRVRSPRMAALCAAVPLLLIGAALAYGAVQLSRFGQPSGASTVSAVPVALVQGSVLQDERWQEQNYDRQLQQHLGLSREPLEKGARVIVWPEAAIQFYLQEEFPEALRGLMRRYGASFIIGCPRYEGSAPAYTFYNSAAYLDGQGVRSFHDKIHLLPFGEYFPFGFIDFLRLRYAAPRQYAPGSRFNLFDTPAGKIGVLICYELIFPGLARGFIQEGAEVLVNITNDAWFGRTTAHEQHFTMAVFTAVAFRRAVLRASNTGISGVVDQTGRIVSSLEPYAEGTLIDSPARFQFKTVYCRWGDVFAWICIAAALFCFCCKSASKNS